MNWIIRAGTELNRNVPRNKRRASVEANSARDQAAEKHERVQHGIDVAQQSAQHDRDKPKDHEESDAGDVLCFDAYTGRYYL